MLPTAKQHQAATGPGRSAAQAASGTGLAGSVPGLLAAATVTADTVTVQLEPPELSKATAA